MNTTTSTRTINHLTDENFDKIMSLADAHNSKFNNKSDIGFYIIDLTGRYQVYYTLYRYTPIVSGFMNPYKFIKNISTDIIKCGEVIKKLPLPVIVYADDNNNPIMCAFKHRKKEGNPVIKFGKHSGKTIAEIWDIDHNWVIWYAKNYKQGQNAYYIDYRGKKVQSKLKEDEVIMMEQSRELISIFFNNLTEKNRQECVSKHIGTLKQRMTLNAKVTSIKKKDATDYSLGYTKINLITDEGDLLQIYDKDYKLEVGDIVEFKGTPTKYFEVVGKNITYFNRIDMLKVNGFIYAVNK